MNIQFIYLGKRGGGVNDLVSLLNSIDDINFNIYSLNNSAIRDRTSFLEDRISFDHLDLPKSKLGLFYYLVNFKFIELFKVLKKNKPNFIIITMFHPLNFFVYWYKFFFNKKVKIYYLLHNDNKIQTFNFFYDSFIRLFDIFYCLISNKIFVLSPNVLMYAKKHLLLKYKDIIEIGFGVYYNPNPIINNLLFYNEIEIRFVFFGKILPYKGLDNLLESLKILKKSNIKFKCYILGEGKFDYDEDFTEEVVILNRWVSDGELDFYLRKSHFSIFPYSHCSQSGALSTALSNNLPVLVSNISILRDQVALNNIGFILDDISPKTIFNKIIEINNSRDKLYQMHCNLIKRNSENSDWKNVWGNIKKHLVE